MRDKSPAVVLLTGREGDGVENKTEGTKGGIETLEMLKTGKRKWLGSFSNRFRLVGWCRSVEMVAGWEHFCVLGTVAWVRTVRADVHGILIGSCLFFLSHDGCLGTAHVQHMLSECPLHFRLLFGRHGRITE